MTEPIRPSVWCRAMWKTGLSVSAVRIAREEYQDCPSRGRKRLGPPALDSFVGEPDREAAALAQAGVIRAPLRDLVVLLGNVAAAVLVQLRGKWVSRARRRNRPPTLPLPATPLAEAMQQGTPPSYRIKPRTEVSCDGPRSQMTRSKVADYPTLLYL